MELSLYDFPFVAVMLVCMCFVSNWTTIGLVSASIDTHGLSNGRHHSHIFFCLAFVVVSCFAFNKMKSPGNSIRSEIHYLYYGWNRKKVNEKRSSKKWKAARRIDEISNWWQKKAEKSHTKNKRKYNDIANSIIVKFSSLSFIAYLVSNKEIFVFASLFFAYILVVFLFRTRRGL